jgi:ribosomal protein L31
MSIRRITIPMQRKKFTNPISTNKKLVMVEHTCHPSYTGKINRRTVVQTSLPISGKILLKKYLKQKGLRAWLKW